jgi:hypothetical protein
MRHLRIRRRTMTLLLGALIVLLVGGVVAYQVRETRDSDAALERAGTGIKTQVQGFHREHTDYPNKLRLRPDAVQMVGTSATETNTIDLDPGVRLAWYSDKPDPRLSTNSQEQGSGYSYCLSLDGRHWRLNATEDAVATAGPPKDECPPAPAP